MAGFVARKLRVIWWRLIGRRQFERKYIVGKISPGSEAGDVKILARKRMDGVTWFDGDPSDEHSMQFIERIVEHDGKIEVIPGKAGKKAFAACSALHMERRRRRAREGDNVLSVLERRESLKSDDVEHSEDNR